MTEEPCSETVAMATRAAWREVHEAVGASMPSSCGRRSLATGSPPTASQSRSNASHA